MGIFYLLTFLICGTYLALMLFYLAGWKRTPAFSVPDASSLSTKVSVVIPVRNETANILRCLSAIRKQTYPEQNLEVIVVDDHSTDGTADLIRLQQIPNLILLSLAEGQAGKKQAIASAIKGACGTLIVTTDADCIPDARWVASLVGFYESRRPTMIVGPVLQDDPEPSFFQKIQSQEMTALSATACASLYYNKPVLCSGANLAYEKEAFLSVNGFEGVERTATGDDVFLMFKMHKAFPGRIRYLKSPEAAVFTRSERDPGAFLSQRNRWASKTFHYEFGPVTGVAMLVFLANFLIFLSGILSVINVKFALALIATLPFKGIADYMLIESASSFFKKKLHPFSFAMASLLYPAYVSLVGIASSFNHYSWKGRKS